MEYFSNAEIDTVRWCFGASNPPLPVTALDSILERLFSFGYVIDRLGQTHRGLTKYLGDHGILEGWHANGQRWYDYKLYKDIPDGVCRQWSSDGSLIFRGVYRHGHLFHTSFSDNLHLQVKWRRSPSGYLALIELPYSHDQTIVINW